MKSRGQTNFEALIILLLSITAAVFITTLYLQTHDVTNATIIARTELVKLANATDEQVRIDEVRVVLENDSTKINATTIPDSIDFGNLLYTAGYDWDTEKARITEKIRANTGFANVVITVN